MMRHEKSESRTEGNNISEEKFTNFAKFIKARIESAEQKLVDIQPKTEEEIQLMQEALSSLDVALKNLEEEIPTELTKETLYDRDETKLIERIEQLRKQHPNLKVGKIQRPLKLGGFQDGVFEVEVSWN